MCSDQIPSDLVKNEENTMKTIAPPTFPVPPPMPILKRNGLKTPMKPPRRTRPRSKIRFYKPVRVLVLDVRGSYCRSVWCSAGLGLANVFIGAVNMAALMYTVVRGDAHVFVCTFAYHFFSAEAILSLNHGNGWSMPMRARHRKCTHVLLQTCGLVAAVAGATAVLVFKGVSGSAHGITGIITLAMSCFSLLTGPCALLRKKIIRRAHMTLGVPTFTLASIALIIGCFTKDFLSWATLPVSIVLTVFVVYYTLFIVGSVLIKCVSRL